MYSEEIEALARRLGEAAVAAGAVVTTAESCTAGGIAYAITEVAGSSQWFDRGFVTYTNTSKTELLGVHEALLERHGAVSSEVVAAMCEGALARSEASIAVSVSGIAGPGGAVEGKPVGTVCLSWQCRGEAPQTERCLFLGSRRDVREQTIIRALSGLLERISLR